jgi:hypothetical protein
MQCWIIRDDNLLSYEPVKCFAYASVVVVVLESVEYDVLQTP